MKYYSFIVHKMYELWDLKNNPNHTIFIFLTIDIFRKKIYHQTLLQLDSKDPAEWQAIIKKCFRKALWELKFHPHTSAHPLWVPPPVIGN